jgi:hypothetical protein
MKNSINKKEDKGLNRRKLFKTGLALAGGSVLASVVNAQKQDSQNVPANTVRGRRKLGGTLEVSSVGTRGFGKKLGCTETSHSSPNIAGMAAGAETVDCAYPGYNTDGAHAGEHWC